ncbi:MAG: caspase family protein [bacterium]
MKPFTVFSLLFLIAAQLPAQTTDPILMLNTEMHTSKINRIATDPMGKYILTCSFDKTAKLWDAATGSLLHTYRVPIDLGNEGMLYACTLSPNAKIIAVGGWTKYRWESKYSIYLFNIFTGEIIGSLKELSNVIFDLEFSPDGKYLAAALASEGVRIFNTQSWELEHSLTGYSGICYNISFNAKGCMASVCNDGTVRLYNSSFELIKEMQTKVGEKPYSLAFSPDGSKLAVGYDDSPTIQVLDGYDLDLLYEPDITGAKSLGNHFIQVCWSFDGQYLIAGGYNSIYKNQKSWKQIRIWNDKGRGSYSDYSACDNSLMDSKPMPDNSILYCGSQPDFGRMTFTGNLVFYKSGETNTYSARDKSYLKINKDGSVLGFTPSGKAALTFDLRNRLLTREKAEYPSYTDSTSAIAVTDWDESHSPKINGKVLSILSNNERSYSTDIDANTCRVIIGASWNLYCIDEDGKIHWKTPSQASVWAVNISGNEKVVVAAVGDGTLRWYRMSDGTLLLSLFVHPDDRWVLYTPSGYYDASAGGENLIGWHLNNGMDKAADFYSISKFRSSYYRPEVISQILNTYDEANAIKLAERESGKSKQPTSIKIILPPTVRIVSPLDGTEISSKRITIGYTAKSAGGESITGIKALIDGRPESTQRGMKISGTGGEGSITVAIPERDCEVSLIAENVNGYSEPARVSLKWRGKVEKLDIRPKLYLLSIGVSQYQDQELTLALASKDASDFANALRRNGLVLYRDVVVKVLTDVQATKAEILDGLEWIQKETTSRDVAMIFFAGHGVNDASGMFYYLPVDANTEKLKRSAIPASEFVNTVGSVAGKVLVFADACHSGNIMGGRRGSPDIISVVNELSSVENGAVTFTSSTGKQYSLEDKSWGNGAFTKALVEGLSGKADYTKTGVITVKALDMYITERVKELTKGRQSPTTVVPPNTPDFPIIVIK